ncbi:hypothetical protein D3C87_2126960 [compost metagenome]
MLVAGSHNTFIITGTNSSGSRYSKNGRRQECSPNAPPTTKNSEPTRPMVTTCRLM